MAEALYLTQGHAVGAGTQPGWQAIDVGAYDFVFLQATVCWDHANGDGTIDLYVQSSMDRNASDDGWADVDQFPAFNASTTTLQSRVLTLSGKFGRYIRWKAVNHSAGTSRFKICGYGHTYSGKR